MRNRYLSKIAGAACVCGILVFALVRVESKPRLSRAQQAPSKDFGKPVSIETGSEFDSAHKGFLACAAEQLQPNFPHSQTEELFNNLNKEPALGDSGVSVGHGGAGIQCTGEGDHCSGGGYPIMMADFNYEYWKPIAEKVKGKYHLLTFLGCEIGQGKEGADFLNDMAEATQSRVRAPDSLIYCGPNGIFFDQGGNWVEAVPKFKVSLHVPKPFVVAESKALQFRVDGVLLTLKPEDVQFVEFLHRSYRQKEYTRLEGFGSSILKSVGFSAPFFTDGRPAAIVTGSFRLRLKVPKKTIERQFVLYNDILVEDLEDQDVFYRVNRESLLAYVAELTK